MGAFRPALAGWVEGHLRAAGTGRKGSRSDRGSVYLRATSRAADHEPQSGDGKSHDREKLRLLETHEPHGLRAQEGERELPPRIESEVDAEELFASLLSELF